MSATLRYVFFRAPCGHLGCDVVMRVKGSMPEGSRDAERLLRTRKVGELKPEHRRVLMQLVMQGTKSAGRTVLRGSNGFNLARTMVESGKAHWLSTNGPVLRWRKACPAELAWIVHEDGGHGTTLLPAETVDFILPMTPPLFVNTRGGLCGPLAGAATDAALGAWAEPRAPMPLESAIDFCNGLSRRFPDAHIPVPGRGAAPIEHAAPPIPVLRVTSRSMPMSEAGEASPSDQPIVRLMFAYHSAEVPLSAPDASFVTMQGGQLTRHRRDRRFEQQAADRLRALGFTPIEELFPLSVAHPLRDWGLRSDGPLDWGALQSTTLATLGAAGWWVEQDPACRMHAVPDEAWFSELESDDDGWFAFSLGVRIGRKRVNLLPVVHRFLAENRARSLDEMASLLEGRHVPVALENRTFALISGSRLLLVIRHLLELFDRKAVHDARGRLRLDLWRAAEIAALEQLAASPWTRPAALRSLAERLARVSHLLPLAGPASLKTVLRPYQQLGLAWLQFLRESSFDGILADDMGLGKTVQTLAHLLMEKEAGRLHRPALIVTPTSVLQNWVNEARRFAPSLRVVLLHGAERKAEFESLMHADLVVTSYALLRRDVEFLHAQTFALVILDEGHYIKNHRAQTGLVARGLHAERRLCLTGTPMENHLGELWALFHFLMPGFLGSAEAFRSRFRVPIEKEGNALARQFLSNRIAPFMLRRCKSEVERELPAKTMIVRQIPLGERQRELYEAVRLAMESRIQHEVALRGLDRSRIVVLTALLKLRQVCCDPRLLRSRDTRALTAADSAKLQALLDMLEELLDEGRRVLLFSQFVGMLSLVEDELQARGREYALLTGATRDRATLINRFQEGRVPLFLISLKAGGTGLNLTAADTVIHYDPWWNPAAESQATDRAHRIGQDKPVFVYRLLSQGTVEERIHALQERKQRLADGILKTQRGDSIRFDDEDLKALLAPLG